MAAPEGAFGICSFWAIDHLAQRGDLKQACAAFAHVLSLANDVGLFAEEIDPGSGTALGNFPQAFTHVGLIDAALTLAGADRHPTQPAELPAEPNAATGAVPPESRV
jgi:GH15 family glucan-1,4-alpha-glucosidase